MSPLFVAGAAVGAVGGAVGAVWAVRAKHGRLPIEAGQTPVFEQYYSALIDHMMYFGLRGCRLAVYREFLVIRGAALAITLPYREIEEGLLPGSSLARLSSSDQSIVELENTWPYSAGQRRRGS